MSSFRNLSAALLATASALAVNTAFAQEAAVEKMVPEHYAAFMDRKKIGPARYFNTSFGNISTLVVKQDPKISRFIPTGMMPSPDLIITDMARSFTEDLNQPWPAHKVMVAVGPNPAKPTDFVTTLVGRAPSDNRADSLKFEGKPVAFLFCVETQGQALSYGAVDYTGETIARSASAYPQLPANPSGAFVYACKHVLRDAVKGYADDYAAYRASKSASAAASSRPSSRPGV
jgi:hypothetical protein